MAHWKQLTGTNFPLDVRLNRHLSIMRIEEDAMCSECAEAEDSFFYLLPQCPSTAKNGTGQRLK